MKNLFVRTLTGIAFTTIIIGSLLLSEYTYALVFILVLIGSLREFLNLFKESEISPNHFFSLGIGTLAFITFTLIGSGILANSFYFGLIPFLLLFFIAELYRKQEKPFENMATGILGLIYVALPISMTNLLVFTSGHQYDPSLLLALFAIIWTYDSGAYLFGMSLGKHRLFERVSPKKSWEGAIGGGLSAIGISWVIGHFFLPEIETFHWLIIGLITVITATYGDLTESLLKRQFKLKDSSHLLPGHGGMLDRFDSLLFAVPSVILYLKLFVWL